MRIRTRPNVICATVAVVFFCAAAILAHVAPLTLTKTNNSPSGAPILSPPPPPGPQATQPPRPEPVISVTVTSASDDVDGDTSSVQALIANPGPDGTISLSEALLA